MNSYQKELLSQLKSLMALDAFYHVDQVIDGTLYRIYNYRLASYTDFCTPGAMECRGIMFEIDPYSGTTLRLAAMPMEKFFNLNENPSTMNMDLTAIRSIEHKADGSLISTYTHQGKLRVKSKASLTSDQAVDAMNWLETSRPDLASKLLACDNNGYTVNMEWCSPHNRIVLGYAESHLKILNARNRFDGSYMSRDQLKEVFGSDVIEDVSTNGLDVVQFVASIPSMVDVEGFVVQFEGGKRVKIKTDWYLSLHHTKDSITNPRRLFEAILDECVDDLRVMFVTDDSAIKIIDDMQAKVDAMYNSMIKRVEAFYNEHHHLDRKSYAIQGRETFGDSWLFGVVMSKYLGRPVDFKQTMKGKWKELGFKDAPTVQESVE